MIKKLKESIENIAISLHPKYAPAGNNMYMVNNDPSGWWPGSDDNSTGSLGKPSPNYGLCEYVSDLVKDVGLGVIAYFLSDGSGVATVLSAAIPAVLDTAYGIASLAMDEGDKDVLNGIGRVYLGIKDFAIPFAGSFLFDLADAGRDGIAKLSVTLAGGTANTGIRTGMQKLDGND